MCNIFRDRVLLRRDYGFWSRLEASRDLPFSPHHAATIPPFSLSPPRHSTHRLAADIRSDAASMMRLGTSRGNGMEFGRKGDVLSSATGRYRRRHVVMRFVTAATANRRGKPRSFHSAFSPLLGPSSFTLFRRALRVFLSIMSNGVMNDLCRNAVACVADCSFISSLTMVLPTKTAGDSSQSATHEIRSDLTVSARSRHAPTSIRLHNWSMNRTYSLCLARCFSKGILSGCGILLMFQIIKIF